MRLYLPKATEDEIKDAIVKLHRIAGSSIIHMAMIADLDWRKNAGPPDLDRLTRLVQETQREITLRKKRPIKSPRHSLYSKVWRIVDGAVKDALYNHPDYLTPKGRASARESIVKRCTGAVKGFIER